ncbi:MAG: fused signal recognition particle receptor [Frankiaceae bacterium]|nr:fused signal recognition particle receptor [Frankiaceae bacterium]
MEFVVLGVVLAVFLVGAFVAFLKAPTRRELPPGTEPAPAVEPPTVVEAPAAEAPIVEAPIVEAPIAEAPVAEVPVAEVPVAEEALDVPPPSAGRLVRLRARLARSQGSLGRSLLTLLARDTIDDDTWDEVEEILLTADVGVAATRQIVDNLRTQVMVLGARTPEQVRTLLRDQLLVAVGSDLDRRLQTLPQDGRPAVILVVGVNGTGKTTTCGKLGRALVGDGRSVVLGAADTFRAAAADQLATWGSRVGAEVVRGPEGADPASIAFDAVRIGAERKVDTVLIDTAGRLHTKQGLMDELGKVKRVVERQGSVDEVLLVLDATTGQNGLVQARVFAEVVDVTGIVLTKLDGTAKGGIVIAVQRELGVPVKLVGLGEGPDDLAPFEPEAFVDALLGDPAEAAA